MQPITNWLHPGLAVAGLQEFLAKSPLARRNFTRCAEDGKISSRPQKEFMVLKLIFAIKMHVRLRSASHLKALITSDAQ